MFRMKTKFVLMDRGVFIIFFIALFLTCGSVFASDTLEPNYTGLPGIANDIGYSSGYNSGNINAYYDLKAALQKYRDIASKGGWEHIPEGPDIELGDRGIRVELVRERLYLSGDMKGTSTSSQTHYFDEPLKQAVINFQKRHGLNLTGVVCEKTRYEMNISVEERIKQIKLNLDRLRMLPQEPYDDHILVNIPDFTLRIFEYGENIITMRAIVGKTYRRTPVLSSDIENVIFSPYWYIPPGILSRDILPRTQEDPEYLQRRNIRVLSGWGGYAEEIEQDSINWQDVSADNFPFILRQDSGPENEMGRVKFTFQNNYNITIHDTPDWRLFYKRQRTFSSGCIRIEKPLKLAFYLLGDRSEWTHEKILTAMYSGNEKIVSLTDPVPVHIVYVTAWADDDRTVHFREDIYHRDDRDMNMYRSIVADEE